MRITGPNAYEYNMMYRYRTLGALRKLSRTRLAAQDLGMTRRCTRYGTVKDAAQSIGARVYGFPGPTSAR